MPEVRIRNTSRFFVIARASGREARHWIGTAERRSLLDSELASDLIDELTEIVKMINGLIMHRRSRIASETIAFYGDDALSPFLTPNP
jgi:hypothetical protein